MTASPAMTPTIALSIQAGTDSEGRGCGGEDEEVGEIVSSGAGAGGALIRVEDVDEDCDDGKGCRLDWEDSDDGFLAAVAEPSMSSRNSNFSSSGTCSLFPSPSRSSFASYLSSSSFKISSLVLTHPSHLQLLLSRAKSFLSSSPISMPPTWPLAPASMNALRAQRAVLIPHAGCHVSSWWPLILRQISLFTSKRPEGVRKRKEGGRKG